MLSIRALKPLAVAGAVFAFIGSVALPARAEDEGTPPAPRAEESEANTLGTPEPGEEKGPNRGRISLAVESDFTTAYFFRGILQERNGFIWEPFAEIGFNLYEGDGAISSVDLGFGIWNSFQSNQTLASGSGPANLYETDYYPSLSLGFSNGLEMSLTYQVYTSPNGAFDTVQNFDLGLGYDDSELWGHGFSVSPSITASFETDGTNFGDRQGSWLGISASPSVVAFSDAKVPLTLTLPLQVGLSMSEYYEIPGQGDDTFGYFSFGLSGSVPLAFIPEDYGSWSAFAGINVLVLGTNLKEANLGDSPWPIGTTGIRFDY